MFDPVAASHEWDLDDALLGRVPLGEVLADCLTGRPGAGRVQLIAGIDPAELDDATRLDYLRVLEQQLRWLHAKQVHALAVIALADPSVERWSTIDVARALDISDGHATSKLLTSAALSETLPDTVQALTEGRISQRHAEAILDTAQTIRPDLHPDLEAAVLPRAQSQTVPELRRSLLGAAARLDAQAAERRRRLAHADRRVDKRALPDGMALFTALLPAQDVEAMWARLDAATKLLPNEDTRTVSQQRADLLVDAVLSGIPHDALPELQGRRPSVGVVIGLSTLLGLDDEPADLAGHGAITAQQGREIAADRSATWHRFVTDPVTGHLLDYGRTTYQPPQQLRDFILHRSPTCSHPGCHRPAYRCDLDHRIPYPDGPTSAANTYPLCRRHHRGKTSGDWTYYPTPEGTLTWHSPTGHKYEKTTAQRWLLPGQTPVRAAPDHNQPLYTDCYASAHQRHQQRHRERQAIDQRTTTDATTSAVAAPLASTSRERLADYLQSLPPDLPPF